MVTLNVATHEYTAPGGRKLPGVTAILERASLIDAQWFTEESRQRGTAIHLLTEYRDRGILDSDQPSWLKPYLQAYERFLREVKPQMLAIEERVSNEAYGFAGTLDRRLALNGVESILDIKSGVPQSWHPIQVSAYALCFDRPLRRFGLHLRDNGRYTLVEYTDRRDRDVFLAALTLYRFLGETP